MDRAKNKTKRTRETSNLFAIYSRKNKQVVAGGISMKVCVSLCIHNNNTSFYFLISFTISPSFILSSLLNLLLCLFSYFRNNLSEIFICFIALGRANNNEHDVSARTRRDTDVIFVQKIIT